MNVQTIRVNIRYSCAMADGAWKTVELGAEGALTPDEDYHQAQLALYHELGQTIMCSPAMAQERLRIAL